MKKIIIAIDGPAGSGKSTSARRIAQELRYTYLDTGAMYRAITLAFLEQGIDIHSTAIDAVLKGIHVRVEQQADGQHTYIGDRDISERIRQADVTASVSAVSAIPAVRERLVAIQQEIGRSGGIVMDGRDIGTVVFPNADLKIFLIASIEERARRRLIESGASALAVEDVARDLVERDRKDSTRSVSPLVKADDAIEIDTSNLSIEDQVQQIVRLARERINDGAGEK
ncbi:MAG: cytidylate kinase [Bacteroidota bacterium]|jgi:cytidylate kinase